MKQIPCEVIRDLFPSYIDGLTSETTNRMIEEHLAECEECREILRAMRGPDEDQDPVSGPSPEEQKEIDFLKKNHRRNRRIVIWSIAGALALALLVMAIRTFLVGSREYTSWAPMHLYVQGNELSFTAVPLDSASAVAGLTYTEDAGIVTMHARSVLASPLYKGSRQGAYTAKEEIREVRIGDRIVWSGGATVTAQASELFATRHAYIGDMPAKNRTAAALNLGAYLGPFTNELKTAKEPYQWWILLENDIPGPQKAQKERDMEAFGQVMVGLIGNLDRVVFRYTADGAEQEYSVTAAGASELFGEDIKNCGENVRTLDRLLEKTGLSLYASPGQEGHEENAVWIQISNQSENEIASFSFSYYKDGKLCSSAHAVNADGSAMKPGSSIWNDMQPMEFGGEWDEGSVLEVEVMIRLEDGTEAGVPGRIRIVPDPGSVHRFILTGNKEKGYQLEQ